MLGLECSSRGKDVDALKQAAGDREGWRQRKDTVQQKTTDDDDDFSTVSACV